MPQLPYARTAQFLDMDPGLVSIFLRRPAVNGRVARALIANHDRLVPFAWRLP